MKLDPSQRWTLKTGYPKPPGAIFEQKRKKVDPDELAKLEATRKFGGLVPERSEYLDALCRMPEDWKPKSVEELAEEQGLRNGHLFEKLLGGWPLDELNDGFETRTEDKI